MIRVEIGQRGHGQNLSRARAEHDAGDADGRMGFDALGQLAFHDVLQARVNGQHHVQTVARGHVLVAVSD